MIRDATWATRPADAEIWLATPEAARRLDPSRLGAADHDTWAAIHTARRRLDWESSRALLHAIPAARQRVHSISHSRGFAAVALVPTSMAVGVDLEWLAPRDFSGMAGIAFSAGERAHLDSLDDPAKRGSTFYEFWTLKEAFAKALRLPLMDALRQCVLVDTEGANRPRVPTTQSWSATVFAPRPQLRLAVVRTHESSAPIGATMSAVEWPWPRTREWPVVMQLEGGVGGRGNAC